MTARNSIFPLIALVWWWSTGVLHAQGYGSARDHLNEIIDGCGEPRRGSRASIEDCLLNEEKAAGSRLTTEYGIALRNLSSPAQARLRESQRAWLVYQKNYCDLLREPRYLRGGSSQSYAQCLLRTTLERLSELAALSDQ